MLEKSSPIHHIANGGKDNDTCSVVIRRERPSRACTQRAAAKVQAAAAAEAARKRNKARTRAAKEENDEEDDNFGDEQEGANDEELLQCSKIVTPLVGELEPSQLSRWNIRSMWQLASVFHFLNVCRDDKEMNQF